MKQTIIEYDNIKNVSNYDIVGNVPSGETDDNFVVLVKKKKPGNASFKK